MRMRIIGMTLVLLAGFQAGTVLAQATQPTRSPGQLPPLAEDPNRPAGVTQNPTRPNDWSDAQGRSYKRSSAGTWTNYDESKANPYLLPDPLILKNGQAVKDADTLWKQRRPEILNDLLPEMYGRIPENTPKVTWEVTATDTNAAQGAAIMKAVVGHIDKSRYPNAKASIHITMYTRSKAVGPVPMSCNKGNALTLSNAPANMRTVQGFCKGFSPYFIRRLFHAEPLS